jgi:2-oxoglutarate ferredoxin oxidoreductase subunit gamma
LIIINSSLVESAVDRNDVTVVSIKANDEAEAMGNVKVANNILLGALLELTGVAYIESVVKSLREVFPKRHHHMIPANVKALERGAELARAHKYSRKY